VADPIHDAAQALLDQWDAHRDLMCGDATKAEMEASFEAVMVTERALADALAARAQPTNDDVLWEGPTGYFAVDDLTDSHVDHLTLGCPPGTRVRVVRATDQPSEDQP